MSTSQRMLTPRKRLGHASSEGVQGYAQRCRGQRAGVRGPQCCMHKPAVPVLEAAISNTWWELPRESREALTACATLPCTCCRAGAAATEPCETELWHQYGCDTHMPGASAPCPTIEAQGDSHGQLHVGSCWCVSFVCNAGSSAASCTAEGSCDAGMQPGHSIHQSSLQAANAKSLARNKHGSTADKPCSHGTWCCCPSRNFTQSAP